MASIEFIIGVVLRVPEVVGYQLEIVGAFTNRVLVEAVKAGFVYDVDNGFLGLGDGERRIAGGHLAIGLHA